MQRGGKSISPEASIRTVNVSRTYFVHVLPGQRATMGTTTIRLLMVVGTATAAHLKDHLTSSQLRAATPPTYSHTAIVKAMTTAHLAHQQ